MASTCARHRRLQVGAYTECADISLPKPRCATSSAEGYSSAQIPSAPHRIITATHQPAGSGDAIEAGVGDEGCGEANRTIRLLEILEKRSDHARERQP